MSNKARRIKIVGTISSRSEIPFLLKQSGDLLIIKRGVVRSVVILCPCGCKEEITVNLDKRTTAAWNMYQKGNKLTLFPSVWRDSGCRSHFIIWNDKIFWCDYESLIDNDSKGTDLEIKILNLLSNFKVLDYVVIAGKLNEIPWAVLMSCRKLSKENKLREGVGAGMGKFHLVNKKY